mgnify:CR=1 FL=1
MDLRCRLKTIPMKRKNVVSKTNGLINWFARNPVAANLVMFLVFFAGAMSFGNISKEMFPLSLIHI